MKLEKFAKILSIILPVIVLGFLILYFFQTHFFSVIIDLIRKQGFVGYLVYIVYAIFSEILPILSSVVFKPVALLIFGFKTGVILSFIGSTIGALINYYIAKSFGRLIVKRIVGTDSLEKIDRFTKVAGWKAFLVLRIISINFYDWVSYAAGLANVNFKTYFLITISVNFIWQLISFYIFSKAMDFSDYRSVLLLLFSYLITLFGAIFMWKKYSKSFIKNYD